MRFVAHLPLEPPHLLLLVLDTLRVDFKFLTASRIGLPNLRLQVLQSGDLRAQRLLLLLDLALLFALLKGLPHRLAYLLLQILLDPLCPTPLLLHLLLQHCKSGLALTGRFLLFEHGEFALLQLVLLGVDLLLEQRF